MQNIYLTPHFTLREMCESRLAEKHGFKNAPSEQETENLRRLCKSTLEPLREKLGLPVVITSGYRTKALNDIIAHSARKSQHMEGRAADFYIGQEPVAGSRFQVSGSKSKPSRRELLIKAFRLILHDPDIDFDQLILYPTFIHVSYVSRERNRRKITTANGHGTYCAVTREVALTII